LTQQEDMTISKYSRKQKRKVYFSNIQAKIIAFAGAIVKKATIYRIALIAIKSEPVRLIEIVLIDDTRRENTKE
jgi:hypothetical protein